MKETLLRKKNYLTIDGKKCRETQRVGYCWLDKHPGYITLPIMREHQCVEKRCSFFQKYEEAPYWQTKNIKDVKKKKSIDKKKEKKIKKDRLLTLFREKTKNKENFAITRVEIRNEVYIVYFVALEYVPLKEIATDIRDETKTKFLLKEIKTTKERKKEIIKKIKTEILK